MRDTLFRSMTDSTRIIIPTNRDKVYDYGQFSVAFKINEEESGEDWIQYPSTPYSKTIGDNQLRFAVKLTSHGTDEYYIDIDSIQYASNSIALIIRKEKNCSGERDCPGAPKKSQHTSEHTGEHAPTNLSEKFGTEPAN